MFDASGHLSAGYLDGNIFYLGSAFACMDIDEDKPYIQEEDKVLPQVRSVLDGNVE